MPRAVPLGLQPLQDPHGRQAQAGMSRLVFAFMWLVHFLPLGMQARIGSWTGAILFWLLRERRKVTRINLAKCFPQMDPAARERLAHEHFRAFCRAFVE